MLEETSGAAIIFFVMKIKFLIGLMAVAGGLSAYADVKCADIFSDHMVLQADMPIRIWGTADAGEKVSVKFMNL